MGDSDVVAPLYRFVADADVAEDDGVCAESVERAADVVVRMRYLLIGVVETVELPFVDLIFTSLSLSLVSLVLKPELLPYRLTYGVDEDVADEELVAGGSRLMLRYVPPE